MDKVDDVDEGEDVMFYVVCGKNKEGRRRKREGGGEIGMIKKAESEDGRWGLRLANKHLDGTGRMRRAKRREETKRRKERD